MDKHHAAQQAATVLGGTPMPRAVLGLDLVE